jgi:hypothetical protein
MLSNGGGFSAEAVAAEAVAQCDCPLCVIETSRSSLLMTAHCAQQTAAC